MFNQLTLDLKDLILRTCSNYKPIYSRYKKIIESMTDDQHICLCAIKFYRGIIIPPKTLIYQGNSNSIIKIKYDEYGLASSVYYRNFDLMVLIIDRNRIKINYKTLLEIAFFGKHKKAIGYLLDRSDGCHKIVSAFGSIENVKTLIDYGIDPNKEYMDGKIFLHYAVKRSNLDIIEYLIEKKPNINHRDKNGHTPLDILLVKYSFWYDEFQFKRIQEKCYNVIKILLDNGATGRESIIHKALIERLKIDGYL